MSIPSIEMVWQHSNLQHESVHKGIPVIGERQLQDSINKYANTKEKQSLSYIALFWLQPLRLIHNINFRVTMKDNQSSGSTDEMKQELIITFLCTNKHIFK